MLQIDKNSIIGKGSHRACYLHPENKNLCVKIDYRPHNKANIREKRYYKLLNKKQYSWRLISKYYGSQQTNLGIGDVFELITDLNGSVSKTLSEYLVQASPKSANQLITGFRAFKSAYLSDALLTQKLHPDNIAVRDEGTHLNLILIDDIGNSELIPISDYFRYFASKKAERKWARFELLLRHMFPNNLLIELLLNAESERLPQQQLQEQVQKQQVHDGEARAERRRYH